VSAIDLAGDGVGWDDELCDALAGRAYDGLPDDAVATTLAQWCADIDRDHPSIVLPTAELAAAAASRHSRRRTGRVVGVAAAVVVICVGGLSLARQPGASTTPSSRQEVGTTQTQSMHARAQVLQLVRAAQQAVATLRWTDAEAALMQAQVHLTGVGVADGRAALSAQLLGLRQQLSRMVSDRAPSGPTTSGHPHRAAAHHVPAPTHSLLATSGGQSAGDQTDHLAGAAGHPTEQTGNAPAQTRSAPVRSSPAESSRPRPAARRPTPSPVAPSPVAPSPVAPSPVGPVDRAPIVWPPHLVPGPSPLPRTGIKQPGIKQPGIPLPGDADRGARTDPWHIRAGRYAGGWDRVDGWHRHWHRHR
jgi:hypothetical protein